MIILRYTNECGTRRYYRRDGAFQNYYDSECMMFTSVFYAQKAWEETDMLYEAETVYILEAERDRK